MNPSLLTESTEENVPHEVGDRFSPTDEELVDNYLKLKSHGKDDKVRKIPELDFYQFDPWELPYFSGTNLNRREAYFFSYLYAKHEGSNSGRINRSTKSGSWQASGKAGKILKESTGECIGTKKIFVHSKIQDGIKFIMHEYSASSNSCEKRILVICKVIKRPVTKAKISNKKDERSCKKSKIPSCDLSCNANSDVDGHDPNMNIDCSTHKKGESSSRMTFEIENEYLDDATCIKGETIHNENGYQNINTSIHNDDNTNHTMTFAPENSVADVTIPKEIDSEIVSHGDGLNFEDDPVAFDSFIFTEHGPLMLGMSVPIFGEHQLYPSEGDELDCYTITLDSVADVTSPKGIDSEIVSHGDGLNNEDDPVAFDSFVFTEQGPPMLGMSVPIFGENQLYQSEGDEVDCYTTTPDSVADVTIPKGIDSEILSHGDGLNYADDPIAFDSFVFTEQGPPMLGMSVPIFREHQLYQSEGDEVDCYTATPDSVADGTIPKGIPCEISSIQDISLGHDQLDYGINFAQGSPMCTEQSLSSLGNSLAVPGGNPSNIPEDDPFYVPGSLWS